MISKLMDVNLSLSVITIGINVLYLPIIDRDELTDGIFKNPPVQKVLRYN